jgi:hypothetical protein
MHISHFIYQIYDANTGHNVNRLSHILFTVVRTFDYDLALLNIKPKNGEGIKFGYHVQPACVPDQTSSYVDEHKCRVRKANTGIWYNTVELGSVYINSCHICFDFVQLKPFHERYVHGNTRKQK